MNCKQLNMGDQRLDALDIALAHSSDTSVGKDFRQLLNTLALLEESRADRNGADYTTAIYAVAKAAANSVINKCADPRAKVGDSAEKGSGQNPAICKLKREIVSDLDLLAKTKYAAAIASDQKVAKPNGATVRVKASKEAKDSAAKICGNTVGDGVDLVHSAIVSLLSEMEMQYRRGESINLETHYTKRKLNKKVWIKSMYDVDEAALYKDVATSPISEVYRAVRYAIQTSRATQTDPRSGYSYLSEYAADPDTGEESEIYLRLAKFADLGGNEINSNGETNIYTASHETAGRIDELVAALNLTTLESKYLAMRLRGFGYKSISSYYNVTENAVKATFKRIKAKAKKNGFTPDALEKMDKERAEKDAARVAIEKRDRAGRLIKVHFGGVAPSKDVIKYAFAKGIITGSDLVILCEQIDRNAKK